MWCVIYNKIPTWENMWKRSIYGPSWCPLCKGDNESIIDLFLFYSFTRQVWLELSALLNQVVVWDRAFVEKAWQSWFQASVYESIKSLPLIVCWGIWLACNKVIFQASPSLPEIISAQGVLILFHFPREKDYPPICTIHHELIDRSRP